ncbi:PREDICTED: protein DETOXIFICATION 27 isoform X3 [Theobroma cacao]|uniref:Protein DETOXIFICATION 27 isoform X3 n=1 Tax=Theobroma cacao TaxID=3641 RepID=A0AB32WT59_THECC|nr:PREDICTED: protein DETOXIFICATION 27 isoform X3 [Theobroma cacao]
MGTIQQEQEEPLILSTTDQSRHFHRQQQEPEETNLISKIWVETKKQWLVAGPSIFSRLAMFSMTVITQAFAGHLGDLNLAAISIATTVIIAITFGFLRFLQSQLKTAVIAWVSAIALAVHVLVSWAFVYKLRVGIVGTAITLDISWWLSVLGLFLYAVCGGCPLSWNGFSSQAFVGLWDFFKLSLASGVMLLLENFYYRILIIVSGYLHNTEIAIDALSICISIFGWESMIPLGFLAATGVRVANELGAGNAKGVKFATIVSVITSLAVGFFFWSIIMGFHEKLAMIFTSSSPVITMVNKFSTLLAFTVLLNCIQPVLSGVAVGSGWQAVVAFVNIGSYYIVGVPLGIFLGLLQFGITGIWAGMICGTVVQTLTLTIITMKCKWEIEAQKAQMHISNDTASYL